MFIVCFFCFYEERLRRSTYRALFAGPCEGLLTNVMLMGGMFMYLEDACEPDFRNQCPYGWQLSDGGNVVSRVNTCAASFLNCRIL